MQNYMVLDEKRLQTPFGVFAGVDTFTCYPQGQLDGIRLSEKNMVVTEVGELVPAYTERAWRKNKPSVEFDRQGMVISVALDQQQEIMTPIGELPAELVKFYPTGELHRIFIVDGQLSGFWTEEEERQRNIPLSFDLGFSKFRAMVNGICFYKSGQIKSIALFPGEQICVGTPVGEVETRVGLALYESGKIKSVEPAEAVTVPAPIGKIAAWDPDQTGIHADSNSLSFTEDGQIRSLVTCDNAVFVQTEEGVMEKYTPYIKNHPLYEGMLTVSGLKLEFDYDSGEAVIQDHRYDFKSCGFTIEPFQRPGMHCSPADCANCSLCSRHMAE
ncbi:hypothetical protein AALB39_07365 [Lachnospiraceae bacterium 54-53]